VADSSYSGVIAFRVIWLERSKDSVYATVMKYGGVIVDKRKLTNDEVVNFLSRDPIGKRRVRRDP
jgi:hypothetical protein